MLSYTGVTKLFKLSANSVKPTLPKIPSAVRTNVVKHLLPASNDPDSLETLRQSFTREAQALEKLGNYDQIPQLLAHFEDNRVLFSTRIHRRTSPECEEPGQRWSESQ